jgi:hypothetical protein
MTWNEKRLLEKAKSYHVFGQARKTGENVPGGSVGPRFHE